MLEALKSLPGEFWSILGEMSPYLILGFLIAGILSVVIPESFVEKHLGGKGLLPVFKASLLGVPLPLCSCGVIPVAASLKQNGANRGATTSFLISTPQTGVDSIAVTFSLLGPVYAVFRPVAAFVSGIIGGTLVTWFGEKDEMGELKEEQCCDDGTCGMEGSKGGIKRILKHGFITLPRDIGKPLLAGLAIAALIGALLPDDMFAGNLGHGFPAYMIMLIIGIPIYVCATSSVPIATALVMAGLSPGAALVFLMSGPATNAATITTIWKVMGRKTAIIYLASVAVTALASGLILDYVFQAGGFDAAPFSKHMHGAAVYAYVKNISALVLLGIVTIALFTKTKVTVQVCDTVDEEAAMVTINIEGMTCSHCVAAVTKSLSAVAGVASVEVSLDDGKAVVKGGNLDEAALRKAVEEVGYTVTGFISAE